ncbi:MAG: TIGR00282 family metallophosphoesterase [Alphaproteobacteria bacterium]|nr:TIGR00282 family metallophosphoesterase [Alphaproteobacteria bacterium]MBF0249440.1 TIGR00282 family metallophosphoesterase [Alphaproteobacteria bacterium]
MKLLYIGDVVGKSGRKAVADHLPRLQDELSPDFVVVNAENAAHGFGVTGAICESLFEMGVDVVTTGNHAWDQKEVIPYFENQPRLLRPVNYPEGTPGHGFGVYEARNGQKVCVIQAMGRLFMNPLDDPFMAVQKALLNKRIGETVDFVMIDVHAEATSEKMAMAQNFDGRATLVAGTHSHIPTADAQILDGGTAYITDVGMTGDYNSVIGMTPGPAIARFTAQVPGPRLEPATGEGTLCAVFVESDDATGKAVFVSPVRLGGRLREVMPEI